MASPSARAPFKAPFVFSLLELVDRVGKARDGAVLRYRIEWVSLRGRPSTQNGIGPLLRPESAPVLSLPGKGAPAILARALHLACICCRQAEGARTDLHATIRAGPTRLQTIAAARLHHGSFPFSDRSISSQTSRTNSTLSLTCSRIGIVFAPRYLA